jgi:hypothetical protein
MLWGGRDLGNTSSEPGIHFATGKAWQSSIAIGGLNSLNRRNLQQADKGIQ